MQNLIFHLEEACISFAAPEETAETFPLSAWRILSNLFSRFDSHRYTSSVTKAYVFAENGAARLFDVELRRGAECFTMLPERHRTALGAAVFACHVQIVTSIVEYSGAYGYPLREQKKCLEVALKQRSPEMADSLLRAIAEVDVEGKEYASALHIACLEGYEPVVETLLKKGAWTQRTRGNAVQAASSRRHKGVVQMLLDSGAEVNEPVKSHGALPPPPDALQSACAGGYEEVAQLLLARGAKPNNKGGCFGRALQAACSGGHASIVRILLRHGAHVDAQDEMSIHGNALQAACAGGYNTVVQILLAHGASVHVRGGYHGSALQAAQARGHDKVSRSLIDAGADIAEPPAVREYLQTLERSAVREVYELMRCTEWLCLLKPYCWHDVTANKRYRVKTSQLKLLVKYKEEGNKLLGHEDVPEGIRQKLRKNVSQPL